MHPVTFAHQIWSREVTAKKARPVATIEEAVFRGVPLERLLRSLPPSNGYTALAVILTSALFSSVHFLRHHGGRRIWQPAHGLFIVGCLFGLAYVAGGHTLWLPITVHGAPVFAIEAEKSASGRGLQGKVTQARCLFRYALRQL